MREHSGSEGEGRGLHRGKSGGKMVPRAGERHPETREKITRPGGKWRQRGDTQEQVCCQREGVNVLLAR